MDQYLMCEWKAPATYLKRSSLPSNGNSYILIEKNTLSNNLKIYSIQIITFYNAKHKSVNMLLRPCLIHFFLILPVHVSLKTYKELFEIYLHLCFALHPNLC